MNVPPWRVSAEAWERINDLARAWAGGDESSGLLLLCQFEPMIVRWATKIRNHAGKVEHEDALQECRAIFLEMAKIWNGDTPFTIYVSRVFKWKVINYEKGIEELTLRLIDDADIIMPGPRSQEPEFLIELAEVWECLTPLQRQAVLAVLANPRGGSADFAEGHGVSKRSYRRLINRAREKARRWRDGEVLDRRSIRYKGM